MATLYILKSECFLETYVGITTNLERRLGEHNTGKTTYTRRFAPWKVIHTEEYETMSLARVREKFLKTGAGRREMKKIFTIPR